MDYLKLVLGIIVLVAFVFILQKNRKRLRFVNILFLPEIFLGIAAGLYLVITSVVALL